MANILYLDCSMGAAGDMLMAALYELLDENRQKAFLEQINAAGIPGVEVSAEKAVKCGITGTYMKVSVDGVEEGADGCHGHGHMHGAGFEGHVHSHGQAEPHNQVHPHTHHHSRMEEISRLIGSLKVSDQVKSHAFGVYRLIAEAESHAHGVPVADIHFHEVGTMDAVCDITAVCLLMEMLGVEKIAASPVSVGSGQVHCAHGILPVPAPATAYILQGVPACGGNIRGELCTPTGAALLKHFVSEFGEMPVMKAEKIGYGMGKKDFPAANCVRAFFGEEASGSGKQVVELSCNIDDMTPEQIGFAMECLFDSGALEVYTVPVGMKKSRPGTELNVICEKGAEDEMARLIFKYTSTLGIRKNICGRYELARSIKAVDTSVGKLRVKYARGYGVTRKKYEYDDLAKIAKEQGMPLDEVVRTVCKQPEA